MISEAIILAGGLGTRLAQSIEDRPKSLALINGKAFLNYLLDLLIKNEIKRVVLALGYKHEMILEHLKNGYKDLQFDYAIENKTLGTGGAIVNGLAKINTPKKCLILNGDSYCDFNIRNLNLDSNLTICGIEVEDSSRYGSLDVENGYLKGFNEKGSTGAALINAGIYIVDKSIFSNFQIGDSFSFEKDFIPNFLKQEKIKIEKLASRLFIDIGTPEDFKRAQLFLNW